MIKANAADESVIVNWFAFSSYVFIDCAFHWFRAIRRLCPDWHRTIPDDMVSEWK